MPTGCVARAAPTGRAGSSGCGGCRAGSRRGCKPPCRRVRPMSPAPGSNPRRLGTVLQSPQSPALPRLDHSSQSARRAPRRSRGTSRGCRRGQTRDRPRPRRTRPRRRPGADVDMPVDADAHDHLGLDAGWYQYDR
jgi:hypothetical protein